MKIWQCYNDLAAQEWYYGPDDVLTLDGTGEEESSR